MAVTKLLVSVRDAEEAELAVAAGVPLIDMKEPRNGPLAACQDKTWQVIARLLPDEFVLSAALGELVDLDFQSLAQLPAQVSFAKVGLAGLVEDSDWTARWDTWRAALPPTIAPVAVAYADWKSAQSPCCDAVLSHIVSNAKALLIDTYSKDGKSVFDLHDSNDIGRWLEHARSLGRLTVLAGSLRFSDIEKAVALRPDYIAVRGAVCNASREGKVQLELMKKWREAINNHFAPSIQ